MSARATASGISTSSHPASRTVSAEAYGSATSTRNPSARQPRATIEPIRPKPEHRDRGGRGAHGERAGVDGFPGAGAHGTVVGGEAAGLRHDHRDRVRGDLFDAVARGVRDRDAAGGRRLDVDHVVADADPADDAQVRHRSITSPVICAHCTTRPSASEPMVARSSMLPEAARSARSPACRRVVFDDGSRQVAVADEDEWLGHGCDAIASSRWMHDVRPIAHPHHNLL